MGGRGAFEKSGGTGINVEDREYSTIGYLNHIKIIQWDIRDDHDKLPTYSNTKNTTYYYYSRQNERIEHIGYYRNHRLVKSVDFFDKKGAHTHYWNKSGMVGRKSHDKKNMFALNERDTRLFKAALKWNDERQ